MKTIATLLTIVCLQSAALIAQNDPKWTVQDLKFISGKWTGSMEWGDMEEYWSEPMGNTMMCSFMCVSKGKVIFYEFIVIENGDTVPVMKLRHFNPGSIAWEDKESPHLYPLIKLENNMAEFESTDKKSILTFERISPTQLKITLNNQDKEGKWEKTIFDYTLNK